MSERERELREALRALTISLKLLQRVTATGWEHDGDCWPSEGRHSAKCRLRRKLLEDIRAALDGGLYA